MQHIPPLIFDLAIMLGIASIITLFFQRIKQPVVLGYLIAGIIVGPFTPPHILVNDIPNIKILSELGVIFLIFSLGLEFSFHKLVRVGFSATVTGFLEVIFMTAIGFGLGKLMGWSFNNSIFLGAALSISSTTIIIKAIEELNMMKKRFAELIFGILIIEDLFAILMLVLLSVIVGAQGVASTSMMWVTTKLVLVIGGWFIVGYFFIPILHRSIMPYANDETITILAVSLCLLLVSLAAYLQYSIALGAFVMGSILAETGSIHRIRILIKPVRDIFAAVFFIATGMLMNPYTVMEQWPVILLITVVTIIGKILSSGLSAFFSGQSLQTSLRVGFGMAQIGEFSFIIVGLGVSLQVIDDALFPIIVAVSVITTFTTPYFIRFAEYLVEMIDKKMPEKDKKRLEEYSSMVFRLLSVISLENSKSFLTRLIINGILIAIIFMLSHHFLLPWIQPLFNENWMAKTTCWLLAVLISSPFIWGMNFSSKQDQKLFSIKNLNTTLFITLFFTILEMTVLSLFFFKTGLVIVAFLFIMLALILLAHQQLEKTYLWFEERLKTNVNRSNQKFQKYEELAPWDTYLVEVKVGTQGKLIQKKLKLSKIREKFGINIVAIQRNQTVIFAPTGNDILFPQDKLIVLGEEKQIEKFRKKIEEPATIQEPIELLENIILKSVVLSKNSELIGKSIRGSKLREHIHGMVVGLERNGKRMLNPDPETHLMEDDILYIAGEASYLESFGIGS